MNDYLAQLIARNVAGEAPIRPRLPSRFAPGSAPQAAVAEDPAQPVATISNAATPAAADVATIAVQPLSPRMEAPSLSPPRPAPATRDVPARRGDDAVEGPRAATVDALRVGSEAAPDRMIPPAPQPLVTAPAQPPRARARGVAPEPPADTVARGIDGAIAAVPVERPRPAGAADPGSLPPSRRDSRLPSGESVSSGPDHEPVVPATRVAARPGSETVASAASTSSPPASVRREPQAAEPTIRVTIGHLEVESPAPAPPPSPARRAGPRRVALSLDDYLARRREGSR